MNSNDLEITPRKAPLSHHSETSIVPGTVSRRHWLWVALGILLVGIVLLWPRSQPSNQGTTDKLASPTTREVDDPPIASPTMTSKPDVSSDSDLTTNPGLPPFAAAQLKQAAQQAEQALAQFVELQLALEEQLNLNQYNGSFYAEILDKAATGDEHFLKQHYAAAESSYLSAMEQLKTLGDTADAELEKLFAIGHQALIELDETTATTAFDKMLQIAPSHAEAIQGQQRSIQIPSIKQILRDARNAELEGDFDTALTGLKTLEKMGNEIPQLAPALSRLEQSILQQNIAQLLSSGFNALEAKQFSLAREKFNQVLKLEPDNQIAGSGIQQTTTNAEVNRIQRLEAQGLQQESQHDWAGAISTYESALKLDKNLQFARAGLQRVKTQQRLLISLQNVIDAPHKLSSDEKLAEAESLITQVQTFAARSSELEKLERRVELLLTHYRVPITVRLLSDEATEIILSTRGSLGIFREKQVTLRPGEYLLIGTRDGCRDVRETILVRPDMAPIDIRCQEPL